MTVEGAVVTSRPRATYLRRLRVRRLRNGDSQSVDLMRVNEHVIVSVVKWLMPRIYSSLVLAYCCANFQRRSGPVRNVIVPAYPWLTLQITYPASVTVNLLSIQ